VAFRAVIFDLFDTLVDLHYEVIPREERGGKSVPPTARALHAAVAERIDIDFDGFLDVAFAVDEELRAERYARHLELPTEERFAAMVERLGLSDSELPARMTAIHMGAIREHTAVPGHHAAVLAELRRRVRTGVCSNFSHSPTALGILEEARLRAHLDAVVISDAVGIRKPRSEIFAAALASVDAGPEEVLHVGDSLRDDVAGAVASGIAAAWITRRVADADRRLREHAGPKPDYVISDLADLLSLV